MYSTNVCVHDIIHVCYILDCNSIANSISCINLICTVDYTYNMSIRVNLLTHGSYQWSKDVLKFDKCPSSVTITQYKCLLKKLRRITLLEIWSTEIGKPQWSLKWKLFLVSLCIHLQIDLKCLWHVVYVRVPCKFTCTCRMWSFVSFIGDFEACSFFFCKMLSVLCTDCVMWLIIGAL